MPHRFARLVIPGLLALLLATQAGATTVSSYLYTYTGPLFAASDPNVTRIDDPLRPGAYDDNDRLTLGFVLSDRLSVNTVWTGAAIDKGLIESFFFNDGRQGAGGTNRALIDQFAFRTDGAGTILDWAISFDQPLFFGVSPTFTPLYVGTRTYRTRSNPLDGVEVLVTFPGCIDAATGVCGTDSARHSSAPGSWTVTPILAPVPAPASGPMALGAVVLAGLVLRRRRRKPR